MSARIEMTDEEFDRWVEALESGEYEQGQDRLKGQYGGYCCLGVFSHASKGLDLDVRDNDGIRLGSYGGVGQAIPELSTSIRKSLRAKLASMNDSGKSFQEIAAWLREHRSEFVKTEAP